jgi:hypothetical protein
MKIPYINLISFDKDNQNYETFGNIAKIEELASYTETDNDVPFSSFDITSSYFECIAKLSKEAIATLFGFREVIIRCCPNKRVVHLALYAKKPRTRKKNFNRTIRILEGLK